MTNTKAGRRIMVLDDDRDLLDLLHYNFCKEGFDVKVLSDSRRAFSCAQQFRPDLVVLDLMMPGVNGIDVCRNLRAAADFQKTYIFFLTARAEPYYRAAALKTGADDYIEKITGLRSLTCKVRTVLKNDFVIRKSIPRIAVGDMVIERISASVLVDGQKVFLSPPEFELLFFLAQNPGRSISAETLLHNTWGSDTYRPDAPVEHTIRSLQCKIGRDRIRKFPDQVYQLVGS